MNTSVGRILIGLSLVCLASLASAQLIWKGETYFNGNRNLVIPPSGLRRAGHRNTFCIMNKAVVNRASYYQLTTGGAEPWSPSTDSARGPFPQQGGGGYDPAIIHAAYGIPTTGGSNAIAIVDAFDFPSALADFNKFSSTYKLPVETSASATSTTNKVFQVVYAGGAVPASGQPSGWNMEEALDIEWAHAMAPNAKIYLVEADSDFNVDLDAAVQVASTLPGVKEVSNSYGGAEYAEESSEDYLFTTPGIVYFASAGDIGGQQEYPAESPNVVGVGGTSLFADLQGYIGETAWNGSGGGPSSFEQIPPYQSVISNILGNARGCPDCSAVADPNTGVWIYSSTAFGSGANPWEVIGGTSVACPVVAAITNQRANFTHSSVRELERIYFNLGGAYYRDVITGSAGVFSASVGWDFITGIGSPNGLFPTYSPPENLSAAFAGIYANTGFPNMTNETQVLSAIKNEDVLKYQVLSFNTPVGQTAAVNLRFTMDKPFLSLSAVQVNVIGQAPLGTTQQAFAEDFNKADKTYGQYVYLGATPANGRETPFSFDLAQNYVNTNGAVNIVIRTIQPTHMATGNYTYSIDQVYLSEVTVPAWDVNLPL